MTADPDSDITVDCAECGRAFPDWQSMVDHLACQHGVVPAPDAP